jgi:hypothetical protein
MGANIEATVQNNAEFNRFGLISVILLLIGCMGGIAVGMGAINYTFTLILVIIPTMTTLSLLLAVSPMKWIINAAIISVLVDILVIMYFLFIA